MIAFQPNGLINGLLLGASPSMTTSSTNRIRSASRQSSSASANRLSTSSAAVRYACIERFVNGLLCHAGSLNRLSGLAGARSDVPVAIEASSRPNDPTRSAMTPGRRARFKPNLAHDVSGIIPFATPSAEPVSSKSCGVAISAGC